MRIIDRYIIRSFLKNYLLSFLVLVGLYVVLDMIFNFDELIDAQQRTGTRGLETALGMIRSAADYYFYQIFLYFAQLSGIIPVVAASFTLMRMSHNNELSALMSAGVPLLRVAAPLIIVALLLNGLLLVDQELLIPNMISKLVRKHDEMHEGAKNSFRIQAMRDADGALLVAGRFFPTDNPPIMRAVSIIQWRNHMPWSLTTAKAARWDAAAGNWALEGGSAIEGLSEKQHPRVPVDVFRTSITPEEIQLYRSGQFVDLLSTQRINDLLARPATPGRVDLIKARHTRFTQPLVNVILLLLAIGCVLTREPQQLKSAAARCVILCGLCMTSVFVAQQFAGQPPEGKMLGEAWPALMAWMPIFIFGPGAVWLLDRVKT